MFALLVALIVCFGLEALSDLYQIAKGKPIIKQPTDYVWLFAINATIFGFTLYALLNWL